MLQVPRSLYNCRAEGYCSSPALRKKPKEARLSEDPRTRKRSGDVCSIFLERGGGCSSTSVSRSLACHVWNDYYVFLKQEASVVTQRFPISAFGQTVDEMISSGDCFLERRRCATTIDFGKLVTVTSHWHHGRRNKKGKNIRRI